MAHQAMNGKPPHNMLHGGSVLYNPVYHMLAYYKKTAAKSRVIHSGREGLLDRSNAPIGENDRGVVFDAHTVANLFYILVRQNLQTICFYPFQ